MGKTLGLQAGRAFLLLLAIWLVVSPWMVGYTRHSHAVNDTIVGILVAAAVILSVLTGAVRPVPLWSALLLGIWTIVTPMMFGQAGESFSANNDLIVGLLIVLTAAIALSSRARMRLFAAGADPEGASGQTSLW
jgi:SPW repeat-containing protein